MQEILLHGHILSTTGDTLIALSNVVFLRMLSKILELINFISSDFLKRFKKEMKNSTY